MQRDVGGTDVLYDLAGQRVMTLSDSLDTIEEELTPDYSSTGGPPASYIYTPVHIVHREDYAYDSAGRVNAVYVNDGSVEVSAYTPGLMPGQGALRATFGYDAFGRQVNQIDYLAEPVPGLPEGIASLAIQRQGPAGVGQDYHHAPGT